MMTRGRFGIMTKRRNSFTLVELLVAVGLLSLIMMLLLQLFSGARKIWTASEKTNNVYADARVAMELMADLINTVQFSHGESADGTTRNKKLDMIFSLDTDSTTDNDQESSSITFVSKSVRDLPMKDNSTRFVSFRLGKFGTPQLDAKGEKFTDADVKTRGKLFMLIYSDKNDEKKFYSYFPPYSEFGDSSGNMDLRKKALDDLQIQMKSLVTDFNSDDKGENEFCQVIAENVVAFKMAAYTKGSLTKSDDAEDIAEPPYMIELQLTVLDRDSYKEWATLYADENVSAETRKNFLERHKRTFTRNIFIGDRWALEVQNTPSTP